MDDQPQPMSNVTIPPAPVPEPPKRSRKGLLIAIIILSTIVVLLLVAVAWFMLGGNSNDDTATTTYTTNSTPETTVTTKTATITAAKTGTKFSFSYPDKWTISADGYTTLTRSSDSSDSTGQTTINFSGTMPQAAGCSVLASNYTVGYYDAAPITGWSGNSYVSFYETDGSTWCFSAGLAATKDASFTVGQTADKLYIQASSNHPSIDTSDSSGDQVYVVATKQFTSKSQVEQYIASEEYAEQKQIIQSLTVVKD